jgi:hypothetical protein
VIAQAWHAVVPAGFSPTAEETAADAAKAAGLI